MEKEACKSSTGLFNDLKLFKITSDIIKQLTAQRNMREMGSEQLIIWAQGVEMQSVQKKALDELKSIKDHTQRSKKAEIADKQ